MFTPSGQPYVIALNGPGTLPDGTPFASARLLTPRTGTSWIDAGGDSIGSYASWPGCMAMTASGLILIGNDEDFGVYGFPIA